MVFHVATQFIGPTNHRGSRVTAKCRLGSIIVPWDYSAGDHANHAAAAIALVAKFGLGPFDYPKSAESPISGASFIFTFLR
jgi:hypothetical protein